MKKSFSERNRTRCEAPDGFNHELNSWSLSDWFTATMGELGEAANLAKKLKPDPRRDPAQRRGRGRGHPPPSPGRRAGRHRLLPRPPGPGRRLRP